MATRGVVNFLPSSARTVSSNSGNGQYVGDNRNAVIYLDVTAVSGSSPTLSVVIEDTIDGVTYDAVDTFTTVTGVTRALKRITNFSRYMRISYTIGGSSPSFTFGVRAYFK